MNTIRLNVNVEKVPPNGEVHLISAYNPNFWLNQPKLEYEIVTEANTEYSFKSTNEVWIVTRCRDGPCEAPGEFVVSYIKVENLVEEDDFLDWSLYITIYIGFSLMFIAFLYFEWRCVLGCMQRCKQRCSGGSQQRVIGQLDD